MRFLRIPAKRANRLLKIDGIKKLGVLVKCKIDLDKEGGAKIKGEDPFEEIRAYNIIKAFGRGFSLEKALELLEDDKVLEIIDISEYAKNKENRVRLKGRVIGKRGKAKSFIEQKTNTSIVAYGKTIAIIGDYKGVYSACKVVEMLLEGRQHRTAFKFLER
jgi:ribosomal RNA assembly protein